MVYGIILVKQKKEFAGRPGGGHPPGGDLTPQRRQAGLNIGVALETINKWYDEGHMITFFTSRTEEHREVTEAWLLKNGFRWHGMVMGKPRGGNYHWIDNHIVRATRFDGKFTNLVERDAKIQVFEK